MTAAPRHLILVADDDLHVRQLLEITLRADGYQVFGAGNGHELVQLAQQHIPHLILTDLLMPQMDGYEAIRQLRADTRTAHIPTLILTARSQANDLVVGFETGADDYIVKPFDLTELQVRVKSHLRRTARPSVHNPLSGLPGSRMLAQELRRRIEQDLPLALLHVDIDNFKTFNDTYGFARGDQLILLVARIVQDVIATEDAPDDFIGHIGGDDFAVICMPERAEAVCQAIINGFDQRVKEFYPLADWQRGYVFGTDRYGILRRFDTATISIGTATNRTRAFSNQDDIAYVAAEVKHYAKMQSGSSYAIDQRVAQADTSAERRTMWLREMLLISEDSSLRAVIKEAFRTEGYSIQEVNNQQQLAQMQLDQDLPTFILADAHMGQPLKDMCMRLRAIPAAPPVLVITATGEETEQFQQAGAAVCLQAPLPLVDIVVCVERFMINAHARKAQPPNEFGV